MSNFLALIAERVINQPLMILPEKLAVIALVLEGRIRIDASDFEEKFGDAIGTTRVKVGEAEVEFVPHASRHVGERRLVDPHNPKAGYKPYRQTSDGTAIIPVHGSLVNRGGFLDALSGVTSYESIKHALGAAKTDKEIGSVLVHMDSGGGEAIGAFETGDAVREVTRFKPVYAVADGLCCSAAYAIASGASRVITSRSSLTGSIGTAMLHLDRSKQLQDAGVKPTLFVTGKRKQQGHPFFELTDEVKGDLRDYIGRINQNFLDLVSNHRKVSPDKLQALEAGVFIGAEAIAHGLVDEVGTFEGALSELASRTSNPKGRLMDKTFTQAEFDQAVAAARTQGIETGKAEGVKEGVTQGVAAERARFKAVQTSDAYKGRETSANHMLHTTSMNAEEIGGVLAGITVAAPAAAAPPAPTGDRSKDAPGGVVIEGAQGEQTKPPVAKNDFEKGKELAASLPPGMRRTG